MAAAEDSSNSSSGLKLRAARLSLATMPLQSLARKRSAINVEVVGVEAVVVVVAVVVEAAAEAEAREVTLPLPLSPLQRTFQRMAAIAVDEAEGLDEGEVAGVVATAITAMLGLHPPHPLLLLVCRWMRLLLRSCLPTDPHPPLLLPHPLLRRL